MALSKLLARALVGRHLEKNKELKQHKNGPCRTTCKEGAWPKAVLVDCYQQ